MKKPRSEAAKSRPLPAPPTKKRASVPAPKPVRDDALPDITERDIKLLWSRAAGRCSYPDCPHELTMVSSLGKASVIGEMAHIVGEKARAARGEDPLPFAERNVYANLILLCRNHAGIIDKKENIPDYPITRLHQMKAAHEQMVRELFARKPLAEEVDDPADLLYAHLVDLCTKAFFLKQWTWFSEHAIGQLLPEDVDESQALMSRLALRTTWPGKYPALEKAILEMATAFVQFMDQFWEKSTKHGQWYRRDRAYKTWSIELQLAEEERVEHWERVSFALFVRFAALVNKFAAVVRKHLNPMFYLLHGDFLIHDSLGMWFGGKNTVFSPQLSEANAYLKGLSVKVPPLAV